MIVSRRAAVLVLLSALALFSSACRSAAPPAATASCGDDARLTAYPALVVIAPHPDDETLGFAGLIDAYRRAGKPVSVVVVTDGDAYCEACRFWKSGSVSGPMCSSEELSQFGDVRRGESIAAAKILGLPAPQFLDYPDTGLAAAWRNQNESKTNEPLRRSDFSSCTSCATCGYGAGPRTKLTAETLTASLRAIVAAAPEGALLATTHPFDGHPDHAALGEFLGRMNGRHALAYAVIHAHTKNTNNADCWYPGPAAPECPCMDDDTKALADPAWVARVSGVRYRPNDPAALPNDADYGEAAQLCLPERLYAGEDALKLRAIRAYASQLGRLGQHPAATDGIIDCSGYLTSFVRRTETFVLVEPLD